MEKHIALLNLNGNPNVGLYGRATDKFCILAKNIGDKDAEHISQILKVPVIRVNIYGTELAGIFCVATSHAVLVPDIIFENELVHLKQELVKHNIKLNIIKTSNTALGNNIILNDKSGIISNEFSKKEVAQIKAAFPDVEFVQMNLAKTGVPGSLGVVTNKGGIFSHNLSDKEIGMIEKLFCFEIGLGTTNMGSPFLSAGVLANSFGFVSGRMSSGYEVARVDESLGFLR